MTIIDLGHGVRWHDRAEWAQTRRTVGDPGSRDIRNCDEFFVHHSGGTALGDPDPAQWVRNIYDEHVHGRGYADIAYEMLCDEHGDLWEGRPMHLIGAATLGHNTFGIACCVLRANDPEGDNTVSPAVQRALRMAFQVTCLGVGHGLAQRCHRDVYPTDCPGQDLADWTHADHLDDPFPPDPGHPGPHPSPAPAPRPRPGWPPYPGVAIRQGSRGTQVAIWQSALNRFGAHLAADGIFGPLTDAATRHFQVVHRLVVDGIVGPHTWGAAG